MSVSHLDSRPRCLELLFVALSDFKDFKHVVSARMHCVVDLILYIYLVVKVHCRRIIGTIRRYEVVIVQKIISYMIITRLIRWIRVLARAFDIKETTSTESTSYACKLNFPNAVQARRESVDFDMVIELRVCYVWRSCSQSSC